MTAAYVVGAADVPADQTFRRAGVDVAFYRDAGPDDRTLQRWRQLDPDQAWRRIARWANRDVIDLATSGELKARLEELGVDGLAADAAVERLRGWAARSDESRRQWRHRHPGVNPVSAGRYAEPVTRVEDLTPRERQVVDLVSRGLKQRVIALELGISVRTVEVHLARIRTKTGSATTAQALARLAGWRRLAPTGASRGAPTGTG